MTKRNLGSFGEHGKPEKKKRRATAGRYSHHTCFHGDAWQGLIGMPPDEVGVYWRIILLMYIRKAAISDADKEMAQLCHCDVRTYKRIKKSLAERTRIVVDDENGILYDERTIRELVDAGFFSEEQTKRAMKRHTKTPARTIVNEADRADLPDNVVPLNDAAAVSVAQVLRKVGAISDSSLVDNRTVTEQNQSSNVQNGHANHYPLPIAHTPNPENSPSPAPPVASPPLQGGDGQPRKDAKSNARRAALDALREVHADKAPGCDGQSDGESEPAGDRKAVRT